MSWDMDGITAPESNSGGWGAGFSAPQDTGFSAGGYSGDASYGDDTGTSGGPGGAGGACRICDQQGHFARDCPSKPAETSCRYCKKEDHVIADCPIKPSKPDNFSACFNCGEQGHIRADCPKPRIYTGICRVCEKEGHPAKECPDRPPETCRNCKQEGHTAAGCTSNRVFDLPEGPVRLPEEIWDAMEKANADDDFDEFKDLLTEYLTALRCAVQKIELQHIENAFRNNGWKYYIRALKVDELTFDKVIIGPNGELVTKYTWALFRNPKPRRQKMLDNRMAPTEEENLAWLAEAGAICDDLGPVCIRCKEKGHTFRTCEIGRDEGDFSERVVLKCFNCDSLEHRMRDCPEPRKNPNACRNCGEEGHNSKECEAPRQADPTTECRKCNGLGHFSRDCPTACGGQTCFNCGQEGHRSSDCTNEKVMKCRNCDAFGHISRDCPEPRNMDRVKCNNCEQMGHYSRNCTNPPSAAADEAVAGSGAVDFSGGGASWLSGDGGGAVDATPAAAEDFSW